MIPFRRKKPLFGVIDFPRPDLPVEPPFQVRGWVLSDSPGEVEIEVAIDSQPLELEFLRFPRPDVARLYQRYTEINPNPGYLSTINELAAGKYTLTCTARLGIKQRLLGELEIEVRPGGLSTPGAPEPEKDADPVATARAQEAALTTGDGPRILLMHIPKTAGTSLNAYIESRASRRKSALHLESLLLGDAEDLVVGKPEPNLKALEGKRFLSAHLKLDTLREYIDINRYFTVTMFRDPTHQTLSHLAWIQRLAAPENHRELKSSPDYIQRIVERINRLGFVEFIDTMTPEEKNFFDNCQTRYLLPFHGEVELTPDYLQEALLNLARFDLVLLTERYDESIQLLAYYMGWEPPKKNIILNVSEKKYFLDLENADPDTRERFARIIRYDQVVYRHAWQLFERQMRAMLMKTEC